MSKTLRLIFQTSAGSTSSISLADPAEPVDPSAISDAMDTILNTGIFTSSGGDLVEKVKAEIVTREVETVAEF
ncbi:MAG: DUF2922 domain-containing protein [Firmicutes bacterium]|nr:DUF2922 domain-containing protein [Bacillota bacterium]